MRERSYRQLKQEYMRKTKLIFYAYIELNPLGFKRDQHQFSPNDIYT